MTAAVVVSPESYHALADHAEFDESVAQRGRQQGWPDGTGKEAAPNTG